MRKTSTAVLLILCTSGLFAQDGGWTSGFGSGFFTLEQRTLFSKKFYNKTGERVSIPRTGLLTTSLYGEFGVLSRLDVIAYLPIFVYNYQAKLNTASVSFKKGEKSSIGDTRVGLKYGIIQGSPLVLSVGLQLGIPTGSSDRDVEDELARFQTGDGEFNQRIHADLGVSFPLLPVFLAAGASLNNRTRNFSNEMGWYISAKASLIRISLKAHVSGLYALENEKQNENPKRLYTTFLNNTSSLTYGAALSLGFLPKLGCFLGADIIADGENTLAGPSVYAGLYLDL